MIQPLNMQVIKFCARLNLYKIIKTQFLVYNHINSSLKYNLLENITTMHLKFNYLMIDKVKYKKLKFN